MRVHELVSVCGVHVLMSVTLCKLYIHNSPHLCDKVLNHQYKTAERCTRSSKGE